jgi:threonine dehydratase
MPAHTPERKVHGVQRLGAEAVTSFANYDEAEAAALHRARTDGMTYVSAYNDRMVIAGNGTVGLEILDQLPEVERVIVCVGGGGLISGIATAIKGHKPACEVIGVCAKSAPTMHNIINDTDYPENWDTLAEALSGGIEEGALTIDLTRQHVDRIVLVEEAQIAEAMRWAIAQQGWLVEGGGAVGVAALLTGVIADDGRPTAVVISGGNVDAATITSVLCD